MYTLIQTAKLNDVELQAWLAEVLSKIAATPQSRLSDLLPWRWSADRPSASPANFTAALARWWWQICFSTDSEEEFELRRCTHALSYLISGCSNVSIFPAGREGAKLDVVLFSPKARRVRRGGSSMVTYLAPLCPAPGGNKVMATAIRTRKIAASLCAQEHSTATPTVVQTGVRDGNKCGFAFYVLTCQ
jgi:hypothetical protein